MSAAGCNGSVENGFASAAIGNQPTAMNTERTQRRDNEALLATLARPVIM
jgi:hypothetical protein